ncbi:MAG: integration host factor subunit alpha [Deltaproteobacteria bacterium]|nr:integration host factor subunit alpha [Deltaproteobacteria bacterium]
MPNVTRKDIANHFLKIGVELDPVQALKYVNDIINIMTEKLANGENVLIFNFGKFSIRHKKERVGRNPKTGKEVMITPRKVVTFHPSPAFRSKINNNA